MSAPAIADELALLTPREVAAWLRCSPPTLYRLLRAGRLRGVHVGTALRIYRKSVRAYLDEQEHSYRPRGSRATFGARAAGGRR